MVALSVRPRGFTVSELAEHVRQQASFEKAKYSPRQAAYDIQKFRSKELVVRVKGSRRYELCARGSRAISAILLLRDGVLSPLLSSVSVEPLTANARDGLTRVDQLYTEVRTKMRNSSQSLGLRLETTICCRSSGANGLAIPAFSR